MPQIFQGLLLLLLLACVVPFIPGLLRDAANHLTRKDLPK